MTDTPDLPTSAAGDGSDADFEVPEEGFRQERFIAPAGATTLVLVRHGESQPAHPDRPFPLVDGHGDPPLHTTGLAQADAVGAWLSARHHDGEPIDAIYVTTLQRTHQTAAPLAAALAMTPVVEPDLREVHLGEWEAGEFRAKVRSHGDLVARMMSEERWDVIPGSESLEVFDQRVMAGIGRIIAAHPGQRVVVVAHGGVIAHLLHRAADSRRFAFLGVDNGSISELVASDAGRRVRSFNQTSHLPPWE